jgi:hypothetical protein
MEVSFIEYNSINIINNRREHLQHVEYKYFYRSWLDPRPGSACLNI